MNKVLVLLTVIWCTSEIRAADAYTSLLNSVAVSMEATGVVVSNETRTQFKQQVAENILTWNTVVRDYCHQSAPMALAEFLEGCKWIVDAWSVSVLCKYQMHTARELVVHLRDAVFKEKAVQRPMVVELFFVQTADRLLKDEYSATCAQVSHRRPLTWAVVAWVGGFLGLVTSLTVLWKGTTRSPAQQLWHEYCEKRNHHLEDLPEANTLETAISVRNDKDVTKALYDETSNIREWGFEINKRHDALVEQYLKKPLP